MRLQLSLLLHCSAQPKINLNLSWWGNPHKHVAFGVLLSEQKALPESHITWTICSTKTANSPRNSNSTISSQFIAKILPFQCLTSGAGCQALNYFHLSESSPQKWLNSSGMNFCWGTPNPLMRRCRFCGANTVTAPSLSTAPASKTGYPPKWWPYQQPRIKTYLAISFSSFQEAFTVF